MKLIKLLSIFIIPVFSFTIVYAQNSAIVFHTKPESIGKQINSKFIDAEPKISPNGRTLYFCRRSDPSNVGGEATGGDIWCARLAKSGKWSAAENMGAPINDKSHNQVIGIRADGNAMMVVGNYANSNTRTYITTKTENGWSKPQAIRFRGFSFLNKKCSFAISPDFRVLIASVDDPKQKQKSDLFVSFLTPRNIWSKPEKICSVLNTSGDEVFPVIANDGKTMYFSSDGHAGYGDFDIFITRRLDETWKNWSAPQNMGEIVNTKGFDSDFTVDYAGKYAYISSNINTENEFDIFRIELPEEAKPAEAVLLSGVVVEPENQLGINSKIEYYDAQKPNEICHATTSFIGEFGLVLPVGAKYYFMVGSEGYTTIGDSLDLINAKSGKQQKTFELQLRPKIIDRMEDIADMEIGEKAVLKNLLFDFGGSGLLEESKKELDILINILKNNATIHIEVAGHTDDIGSELANENLSQKRAQSVVDYLTQNAVSKERLSPVGYGESSPIAPNISENGRAENRRVEVEILAK